MSRSMVGLLAAAGAIMSALVAFTHGDMVPVVLAGAGAATGLASYLAAVQPQKKPSRLAIAKSILPSACPHAYVSAPHSPPSFR